MTSRCRRPAQMVVAEDVVEVGQNPLCSDEVWLSQGVHMKAHLMDNVGNVESDKGGDW